MATQDVTNSRLAQAKKTIARLGRQKTLTKNEQERLREAHVQLATAALLREGIDPTPDAIRHVLGMDSSTSGRHKPIR